MSRLGRFRTIALLTGVVAVSAILPGSAAASDDVSPKLASEYARQWNLRAIHAEEAWDAGHLGSALVSVAVLDTGIDTEHPDLAGLVDLERSKSFLNKSNKCRPGEPGTPSPNDEDHLAQSRGLHRVTDFHSHGTAVAGLISSNAVHLAGVTQHTTLFGVKVHDRGRRNCLSVYLDAVEYAADNGADVIHMSFPLEFRRADFPLTFDADVARVDEAMEYAHRKGAVLVAAAGNAVPPQTGQDLDAFPNTFRFCKAVHVICVSATGPIDPAIISAPAWDARADYSHYGSSIVVAGPGGTGTFPNQKVPVWLDCARETLVTTGAPAKPCGIDKSQIWASTGTSFGAAATSGVLALLVDRIGTNRPDEVVAALKESADDIEPYVGFDVYYGYGRINAARAAEVVLP